MRGVLFSRRMAAVVLPAVATLPLTIALCATQWPCGVRCAAVLHQHTIRRPRLRHGGLDSVVLQREVVIRASDESNGTRSAGGNHVETFNRCRRNDIQSKQDRARISHACFVRIGHAAVSLKKCCGVTTLEIHTRNHNQSYRCNLRCRPGARREYHSRSCCVHKQVRR
jgi:hypothetical protein